MKAYVLVNIRTGSVKDSVKALREVSNVTEANMTFGPYDAVVVIETEGINDVGAILTNEIQAIPGILETLTCLSVDF